MSGPQDDFQTTDDAFLGGKLMIRQTRRGSRAGIDAVFLAAACPARAGERVLDVGSGSGIVALAIARRVEGVNVTGLEIDAQLCALAGENARENGLSSRAGFLCGDVTGPSASLFATGLSPDSFDHAVANPPFLSEQETRPPPEPMLRRAHTLAPGDLERWVRCLAIFVKPGGTMTIVHRADALPRLLEHCSGRFGALTVYPLFPREGAPASRIILQGRKGSRAPVRLLPGMTLHMAGRDFTSSAQAILRDGVSLEVTPSK
ncbi:MAG: tRNA1(Val) (adenine(37)-N6)-methyltransferase [Rhodomicrobiaceae bacterium]